MLKKKISAEFLIVKVSYEIQVYNYKNEEISNIIRLNFIKDQYNLFYKKILKKYLYVGIGGKLGP